MRRRKATAVRGGSSQDGRRDDLLGRRIGTEATSQRPACLASVCDGQRCIGFLLSRGKAGMKAHDTDGKSLGVFPTAKAAADAISAKEAAAESRLRCLQSKGKRNRRRNPSINLRRTAP